jgi:hypothetical protein
MDRELFERAQDFIWKNARLIDRQLFAFSFLGGSREAVVAALSAYQNADGGFGNALEPDKRCPESQPVDVQMALEILDKVGALTDPRIQQELILPVCDFLSAIAPVEGGVPFALPAVNHYPHAPWWQTPENPPAAINPTAAIVGMLLKSGVTHPFVQQGTRYCWENIEASQSTAYHDVMPMVEFLENAPDRERAGRELARIEERIRQPGVIAYDPAASGYVQFPLDWAPAPQSALRGMFTDQVIADQLAFLAAKQLPDGGWPITWEPVSSFVALEWRGWVTVMALRTLQAFGMPA